MRYTIYVPSLGEITLHLSTATFSGRTIFMRGLDNNHERINFTFDQFVYPDSEKSCGFCHITSYTKGGVYTPCNMYQAVR